MRASWLGLLALAACGAARGGPSTAPASTPTYRIDAIPVVVDGRGPFAFGFDTGQSVPALLTPALARELGLEPIDQVPVDDGSGANAATADLYRVGELSIGAETFRDVLAIAFDAAYGPERGEELGGALGFPLFVDHLLTVAGDELAFETGALPPPDGATVLAYEAPHMLPVVAIELAGRPTAAVLDSANPKEITLPLEIAGELPLRGAPRVVGRMSTLFNEFDVLAAELDGDLVIGAHVFPAPTLEFNAVLPDAIVGRGLTGRFRVTFDQRNRRVRLLPRTGPNNPRTTP